MGWYSIHYFTLEYCLNQVKTSKCDSPVVAFILLLNRRISVYWFHILFLASACDVRACIPHSKKVSFAIRIWHRGSRHDITLSLRTFFAYFFLFSHFLRAVASFCEEFRTVRYDNQGVSDLNAANFGFRNPLAMTMILLKLSARVRLLLPVYRDVKGLILRWPLASRWWGYFLWNVRICGKITLIKVNCCSDFISLFEIYCLFFSWRHLFFVF